MFYKTFTISLLSLVTLWVLSTALVELNFRKHVSRCPENGPVGEKDCTSMGYFRSVERTLRQNIIETAAHQAPVMMNWNITFPESELPITAVNMNDAFIINNQIASTKKGKIVVTNLVEP